MSRFKLHIMQSKFILLFLLLYNIGNSQELIWEVADRRGGFFTSLSEDINGDWIATMAPDKIDDFTKIVKYDKYGKELDETDLFIDSMKVSVLKIIKINSNDTYLLLGNGSIENSDSSFNRYFVTATMDMDMQIENIKVNRFDVGGNLFNMNYYLTDDEKILVSVNVFNTSFGPESEQIFLRLDITGTIEYSHIDIGFNCYSIIENGTGYMCVGTQNKYFNEAFEYESRSKDIHRYVGTTNQSRAVRINDNLILLGSRPINQPELNSGAVLYYVDNEMKIVKKNWITNPGYTLPGNVFDIAPDSSIFLATFEFVFTGLKSFSVGKFDNNLNLKWLLSHSDGNSTYSLWGMEATHDNGVIIYGNRKIWYYSEKSEAYAIKIDSEGKIVSTYNIHEEDLVSIKTFPNPISKEVTLEINGITGEAEVRVFDMAGRNLYVQHGIMNGSNTVDLSGLSSGTYIYKLYQGRKEISSGQWVKM